MTQLDGDDGKARTSPGHLGKPAGWACVAELGSLFRDACICVRYHVLFSTGSVPASSLVDRRD